MRSDVPYWFPAKRYGWGWGLPMTWQGWAVFIGFLVLLIAGIVILPPHHSPAGFAAYVAVFSLLFAGVCWWKGEPPRWRWKPVAAGILRSVVCRPLRGTRRVPRAG